MSITPSRGRRGFLAAAIIALLIAVVAGPLGSALASHSEVSLPGSNFEIDTDANLKVDDPAPSIDWANVAETRKADTPSGSADESFGNGTKEDTAVPSVVDGGIPPNKSDLKFFGVYQEGNTSGGFLNLFWSRVQEPSGTTNMDFEFNQSSTASANGITPIRSGGDLLIQYDLSQGGTNPKLFLSTWVASGSKSLCEAANATPCWSKKVDLTAQAQATGSINTSAIPAGESDGLGAHSARTFGEAQLSLAVLFPDPTICKSFGSAYLKSRSSDSFTAALKDFVPPVPVNISNCGSVKIIKTDDLGAALAGAEFTLYKDNAPVGGSRGAEDTATSEKCTTASNGECTIVNVLAGEYWVVETVTPPGHATAADQHATVTADTTVTLTFVDPRQRGAIRVVKTAKHFDTSGQTSANLVATFTVKQGTTTVGTITTDASGIGCLDNLLLGSYTVEETSGPAGYAKDNDIETVNVNSPGTCSSGYKSVSFENRPLSNITVSFESQVPGGTAAKISCTSLTPDGGDSTPNDFDDTSEKYSGLTEGTYTCTIVVDP
jgi:hypothetical protein